MTNANGTQCWTQSSDKYVEESVNTVEEFLRSKGKILPTRFRTPMRSDYKPELDTSPELAAEGHSYYQELIGILRRAVELCWLDILLKVSLMSTYLAAPRKGHLEQVFHTFRYLKRVPKRRILTSRDSSHMTGAVSIETPKRQAQPMRRNLWASLCRFIVLWTQIWQGMSSPGGVKRGIWYFLIVLQWFCAANGRTQWSQVLLDLRLWHWRIVSSWPKAWDISFGCLGCH
jgi:hypothetical protein